MSEPESLSLDGFDLGAALGIPEPKPGTPAKTAAPLLYLLHIGLKGRPDRFLPAGFLLPPLTHYGQPGRRQSGLTKQLPKSPLVHGAALPFCG